MAVGRMNNKLLQPDLNTHSLAVMLRQYQIDLNGKAYIHMGAHDAIEFKIVCAAGVSHGRWFECNPFIFPDLEKRLHGSNHTAHFICLWSQDKLAKDFFFYRDKKDGAGSLYQDAGVHQNIGCQMTGEKISVRTKRFDRLVEDGLVPNLDNVSLLVMDLQGAEIEAIFGSQTLLNSNLEWIISEATYGNIYVNGPIASDLDNYLEIYGFKKVGYREDWNYQGISHGDNIYRRV